MKTLKRLIGLLFIIAVVAGAIAVLHMQNADKQKIEFDTKTAASSAKDAVTDVVKSGTQAAGEVATNVAAVTKKGVQKAGEMATNVAAKIEVETTNVASHVKTATTNLVSEVKEKVHDATK